MNIFEFAIQMEKDGEDYYRQLARQTDNSQFRKILTMLADEEVEHRKYLEKAQTEKPQTAETTVLADSRGIFEQIKDSGEFEDLQGTQIDLYEKARDLEQKNQDYYTEKAAEVKEDYQKELFLLLAEEEKKHFFLLNMRQKYM